jgi:hypothetical protein
MPCVSSHSISEVWKQAIILANGSPGREIKTFTARITELEHGDLQEDSDLRTRLDQSLIANGNSCVETVAGTIFPWSLWNPRVPRARLFERYTRIFPKLKKHPKNRRGTYFQRMIAYPSMGIDPFNQLEQVISTYLGGNHRRSALQASIIVPRQDLNDARQLGFPCMHQVAFLPDGDHGTLEVVGFYPMQYLYERAYGNYLGLIRLGQFMAHEMSLQFTAMSCVNVVTKLEVSKAITEAII